MVSESEVPLNVSSQNIMMWMMGLPEVVKCAINHQGGYKTFLRRCKHIEISEDGWIRLAEDVHSDEEEDAKVRCPYDFPDFIRQP